MGDDPKLTKFGSYAQVITDKNKAEKIELQLEVEKCIASAGLIPAAKCTSEVDWFFNKLAIAERFFFHQNPEKLSEYIHSIYASKVKHWATAKDKSEKKFSMKVEHEMEGGAILLCNSEPGISVASGPQFEKKIDQKYLCNDTLAGDVYRVETYRSKGSVDENMNNQLRCYFVDKCVFLEEGVEAAKNPEDPDVCIRKISSTRLLEMANDTILDAYEKLMKEAFLRKGPVSKVEYREDEDGDVSCRLIICYKRGEGTRNFFSSLSDLYHYYDLFSLKKYVEHFANGYVTVSLHLKQLPTSSRPDMKKNMSQLVKEIGLLFLAPVSSLHELFLKKKLSVMETTYAYAGWLFAEHFLNRLGLEYEELARNLDQTREDHLDLLSKLKSRLRMDTFSEKYIKEVILSYPVLIHTLYRNFHSDFYPIFGTGEQQGLERSYSLELLEGQEDMSNEDIQKLIKNTVKNKNEQVIFECLLTFNKHILKTNFFTTTKVALSFRLDPAFLPKSEYPRTPYGMFFVVGREFRGFHVRFSDVARGGIRVVRSPTQEVYYRNVISLFDENYNLASTQQLKNKDIPEGGSKGTVLLTPAHNDKAETAFKKYVDSILDLLLIGNSPGIKDTIIDKYEKEEILFLGPDEGTADLMDWASLHAKKRSAPFWKAFTTGKSTSIGGIPHDTYGMTTRSVHQYVLGIMRKEGLEESKVTKFQTGGPDGDLGSNEIKISKDKTIAIVDGSGVLCDPEGIDREEMTSLAKKRVMIQEFDMTKLSKNGFRVLCSERNVELPDGTLVENGIMFRNTFHLNHKCKATFFVPCGGRPEAINITNVKALFDEEGKAIFTYIVEGANLFITNHARHRLEKSGVILFKDSSANKGGVTSSSFEVFSGLALSDKMFDEHMRVKDGVVPEFYKKYVVDVQNRIEKNAELEFECIWREHEKTGMSRITIAENLSVLINEMSSQLAGDESQLWNNEKLKRQILSEYCPKTMLDLLGLDEILANTPVNYLKAIFGAYLASRFVYSNGLKASPFAFFEYMQKYN